MSAAIAITRMAGSGAEDIARILSETLNVPYMDREIIARSASLAGVSEEAMQESQKVPSFLERIAELLGQYPSFEMMMSMPSGTVEPPPISVDSYRHLVEDVIRTSARQEHAVILGHGAPFILKDQPDVLRVFIHASRDRRIERLMTEETMSRPAAEKYIQKIDQEWAAYIRNYYNADWRNPSFYDITVNTDRLSIEVAAQVVLTAVKGM
ncbi:MAG TPA: cytidylate kinase-like family protein [Dehalococcoidia bacterium]|nr:cytidylate kinase-like family protein [Dehalococcoidia bacterium]